jgi:hypothetical protein
MKGNTTMANKAEERRNTITEYLQANPGSYTVDQIAEALNFAASDTARALTQLARTGTITETEPDLDGAARWTAAPTGNATEAGSDTADDPEAPEEAEPGTAEAEPVEDDGDADAVSAEAAATGTDIEVGPETPSDDAEADAEPTGEADRGQTDDPGSTGDEPEDAEPEGDATEPGEGDTDADADDSGVDDQEPDEEEQGEEEEELEPVDPDPAVLLVAAQLAAMDSPVGLEQVALAAFRIAAPKTVETTLHVLCALAEHGAVECSTPYRPDDRDREDKAEWTVVVEAAELDRIAAVAQLADAPASVECPTCGSETELPHLRGHGRKPVGPTGKKRSGLANGELRDMLLVLVKENPGEELKPGDFVRELRNDPRFKDRISANPSGAVRSALLAMEKNGWVTDLGTQPLTYRCRDAQ